MNKKQLREEIAKAVYELDPCYEVGEYIDGFQVSPGGNLTWKQASDRDAEFGGLHDCVLLTEFAYKVADAMLVVAERSWTSGFLLGIFLGSIAMFYILLGWPSRLESMFWG